VTRSVYPVLKGKGVKVFALGGNAEVISVKVWELMPSNPF
jgi:beta-fructofuranosidase